MVSHWELSALFLRVISILVLYYLWQDASDLLLEQKDQLFFHFWFQVVLLAELFSQGLGGVSFINDNSFSATLSNVDVDVQLWVSFINSVFNLAQLLVNKVFWVLWSLFLLVVSLLILDGWLLLLWARLVSRWGLLGRLWSVEARWLLVGLSG